MVWGKTLAGVMIGGSGLYMSQGYFEEQVNRSQDLDVSSHDENVHGEVLKSKRAAKYPSTNRDQSSAAFRQFAGAIEKARTLVQNIKDEHDCPGVSVAVSVNGDLVWNQGFGYADLENHVPCTPDTAMKIASISKPITVTMLCKQWELGVMDIDEDIKRYIKYWPEKYHKGEKVSLTPRLLASHKGGLRDYKRIDRSKGVSSTDGHNEFEFEEYYIKERYTTVKEALELFMHDPLIAKPGERFHYTTHGFSVISAALEGATKKTFPVIAKNLFNDLGMMDTNLDDKNRLVYNRASYYVKDKNGLISNAAFTESSFKWAGAGMISTVLDLVKFGNIYMYSYACDRRDDMLPGYLDKNTVKSVWAPVKETKVSWDERGRYGMGWQVIPGDEDGSIEYVGHTGGTIGASCALILRPTRGTILPSGIVVAVLGNMQGMSLGAVAIKIIEYFENAQR